MEKIKYGIPVDNKLNIPTVRHCRSRSSRPEVFSEKGVLRNFAKFTGKDLCQSLFFNKVAGLFNKVAGLRPATLLKKRLWRRNFPVNFVKFSRTPFCRTPLGDSFYKLSVKRGTFSIEKTTIFIFSFCIGLVTQLNDSALGVLKHHFIIKRIC